MPEFTDKAPITSTAQRTSDGFLVVEARVARTGIQEYLGREMGRPDLEKVRVYRPADAVFAAESLRSYAHRPVTAGHPAHPVNSTNWKQHAIGHTGDEVLRDGEFVRVPMVLMDKTAIEAVEDGSTKEISMGYTAHIEFKDGKTESGEPYDAVMTGFRMNHLAVVARARGGSDLSVGDGERNMPEELKTVMFDGLSISTTAQGAEAIKKLETQLADSKQAVIDAKTEFDKQLATKDAELATKDARIGELEKQVLTDAELDKKVAGRAGLIADAKRVFPKVETDGKSDADIKRQVVASQHAITDKSDAYIDAMFDIMLKAKPDPVRSGFQHQQPAPVTDGNERQKAFEDAMNYDLNAWKGEEKH